MMVGKKNIITMELGIMLIDNRTMKTNMKIKVTFRDAFSFAILEKEIEGDMAMYAKMKNGIGSVVHKFGHNIHWIWVVENVELIEQL